MPSTARKSRTSVKANVLYAVMEHGYEYNDEVHHRPESGGGTPVKLYRDRAKAETNMRERTREFFKENHLSQYGYGADEVCNDEGWRVIARNLSQKHLVVQQILTEDVAEKLCEMQLSVLAEAFDKMSEEDFTEFFEHCHVEPYSIQEVTLEE